MKTVLEFGEIYCCEDLKGLIKGNHVKTVIENKDGTYQIEYLIDTHDFIIYLDFCPLCGEELEKYVSELAIGSIDQRVENYKKMEKQFKKIKLSKKK